MDAPTYLLEDKEAGITGYYADARTFTGLVLRTAKELVGSGIDGFMGFTGEREVEKLRSFEEYLLESLMLGTFLSVFGSQNRRSPTLEDVEQLLCWLEQASEFPQEIKRLAPWYRYLAECKKPEAILTNIKDFAQWFEFNSNEALGKYTTNVEQYLAGLAAKEVSPAERVVCGRSRVEYHLNMVGAEIMNDAFRSAFLATTNKAILLPGCMRAKPEEHCLARTNTLGATCVRCTAQCKVNHLSSVGRQQGFSVLIVDHRSAITAEAVAGAGISADVGVVGIACVLNLIAGGWMLRELGIPAQCVLLNYSGCRQHWHETGIPTDLDGVELERILGLAPIEGADGASKQASKEKQIS